MSKRIAITFDDGPDPSYTAPIVSLLDGYGIKGTFFMLGRQVAALPALAKKVHDGGHLVGNHGYSHPNFRTLTPKAMTDEIERTAHQMTSIGIERPRHFRPPYGDGMGPAMDAVLAAADLDLVLWTIDPRDWEQTDPRKVTDTIVADLEFAWKDGVDTNVIVFHDTYPSTPDIIRRLIPQLIARDCEFVTAAATGPVPETAAAQRAADARTKAAQTLRSATIPAAVFEADYRRTEDPFGYESNRFEHTKYRAQIALLAGRRFSNALELACSIGVFTELLAPCCDRLLAVDISSQAVERARLRCEALPNVDFAVCSLPGEFPQGSFDLVTFAEFGYYLGQADLESLKAKINAATKPGAALVLCHMPVVTKPYLGWALPSSAESVHAMYARDPGWKHVSRITGSDVSVDGGSLSSEHYRCDLFERAGEANASFP